MSELAGEQKGGLVGVFGWDGDKDAAIAYPSGLFLVRDPGRRTVGFRMLAPIGPYDWHNLNGYLPCLVTEFQIGQARAQISSFADRVQFGGRSFVVAYSRLWVEGGAEPGFELLGQESPGFTRLAWGAPAPGGRVWEFALPIDRFGGDQPWPSSEEVAAAGGFDRHLEVMRAYWEDRLGEIARVRTPLPEVNDSHRAGYVYTHIVKDGSNLHVGENGYDGVWDHDAIGILASLIGQGCLAEAPSLLAALPTGFRFEDATYKYPWPFALYLLKTGDAETVRPYLPKLRETMRTLAADRTGQGRTMKPTMAIDTLGCWTIDNWSALTGLAAYSLIGRRLGEANEERWAAAEYADLLACVNAVLSDTTQRHGLTYIPASLIEPNDANRTANPADANWASHLLFGRWAFDAWLLGAPQHGPSLDLIDDTYTYGLGRLHTAGLPSGTFGGFPGPWPMYATSYNAGYGSAALRGRKHRTCGVEALRFMIERLQSGPHSYWETAAAPEPCDWRGDHTTQGNGSCPHMWGQSVNSKVLLDSLVAQFADGRLLLGRGLPWEWLTAGPVAVDNYPANGGCRANVRFDPLDHQTVRVSVEGELEAPWLISLPAFVDAPPEADSGRYDPVEHWLELPPETRTCTVRLP